MINVIFCAELNYAKCDSYSYLNNNIHKQNIEIKSFFIYYSSIRKNKSSFEYQKFTLP